MVIVTEIETETTKMEECRPGEEMKNVCWIIYSYLEREETKPNTVPWYFYSSSQSSMFFLFIENALDNQYIFKYFLWKALQLTGFVVVSWTQNLMKILVFQSIVRCLQMLFGCRFVFKETIILIYEFNWAPGPNRFMINFVPFLDGNCNTRWAGIF